MKKILSIQNLLPAFLLVCALGGCKKWLDTTAPLQVSPSSVFSSEQGFKDALSGIYLQMGTRGLYGREMTDGLLSVLGRSYDTTMLPQVGSLYYQGAAYNFQDPSVQTAIRIIWDSSYQCIAGLNNMLAQIDGKKNLFSGNDFYDVKAEAVALRAFLHFDLLRLFGPAQPGQNLSVPALPYMKQLTPTAQPVASTGAVLDSCISDLNLAASLYRDSVVVTGHLNYWGVKALLARLYMYEGDMADAQTIALQLIGTNKFPLVTSNTDPLFLNEHVFSIYLYGNNQLNFLKSLFNTPTPLGLESATQTTLYVTGSGGAGDYRKAFQDPNSTATTGAAAIMPKKLSSTYLAANNVTPLIRMSEMYFIAAECAQQLNGDLTRATAWLDTVRVHRGLASFKLAALPHDSITTEIAKEYRKEFIGEGQVFFYFKRNNLPFNTLPLQKVAPSVNASYVLPKPE